MLRACCLCSLFFQQAMALLCAEGGRLSQRHAACAAGSAYNQPAFCVPRVAALCLQAVLPLMQQVPTAIALDSADPLERMTRLNKKSIAGDAWAQASAAVLPWWVPLTRVLCLQCHRKAFHATYRPGACVAAGSRLDPVQCCCLHLSLTMDVQGPLCKRQEASGQREGFLPAAEQRQPPLHAPGPHRCLYDPSEFCLADPIQCCRNVGKVRAAYMRLLALSTVHHPGS